MSSKNNNVKNSHLSEDELLNHSLMYQVVFLLRTIASQCHMLVPKALNDIIRRWVGHGLCSITAMPSKLSCPITGKTFLNRDVYKDHFKKNKKKINKIKKKNKGKKPAPPTDLPKFPDVDWTAFLKADNHHSKVMEELRKGHIESTIWNFSTGPLKAIDYDVRPGHCGKHAVRANISPLEAGGRGVREVICHGTHYDELMALIAWYAVGETSENNGWCSDIQQKPEVRQVRACSIGDVVYENIVQTKAWPVKGKQFGECHLNALSILLSEGKGSLCVGYHAVAIPCLSFYTIVLEPHVVYFDGKTYWDATVEGEEMLSDTGLFVPLMMIDIDGKRTTDDVNRYRAKHSYVRHQILTSYGQQMEDARTVVRCNNLMQSYTNPEGTYADLKLTYVENARMMMASEGFDESKKNLEHEKKFFYKAMEVFDDVDSIRDMCSDMCDRSPWLTNPFLVDSTPGLMGIPGLQPIAVINVNVKKSAVHGNGLFAAKSFKAGDSVYKEHTEGGLLIHAPVHVSLLELGGVQSNCSKVWGLIVSGEAQKGWVMNLHAHPRIEEYMTQKDYQLLEFLVDAQCEGKSREQVMQFRGTLLDAFCKLETNQFTVNVPGAEAPMDEMAYVGKTTSNINHSDDANIRMQSQFEGEELMYVEAIALRDIQKGEELFIDYGEEYKQLLFGEKKEEEHKQTIPTVPISQAEEVAARLGGGLNIAAAASLAIEEWCPHCQSLEHPMTKCPKKGQYHLDIFKANNNHVSNGRSGDDNKRQELEQTSDATGNNQIEFKDIVSKCLDGCNNNYGPLPKIIGMVVEQVRRELTEHETALVNEMLKMRKRLLTVSNEEEKDLVTSMYGKSVKQAEKEVEIRMAKKTGPLKTPPRRGENGLFTKAARKSGPRKVVLNNNGDEVEPAKKRKRYSDPKPRKSGPAKVKKLSEQEQRDREKADVQRRIVATSPARKCGPAKWNETKPLKQVYDDGSLYAKQVVVANQKKLCTFFLVWSELASFKDKEESKQINDKAWEMYNIMEGMEEKDWNDSVTDACQLHVKYRRNGNVDDEDFERLFEYVLDFHGDNPCDGLNGRELYYSYEHSYLTKEEYEQEFNFYGKRINDCWTDLEEYQSMVDCRLHELHEKYEDDDEKLTYVEFIRDLNEQDKDWRKRVKKDSRVGKAVKDFVLSIELTDYPLKTENDGETGKLHDENAVNLIALLRIWARILGLPEKKVAVSLGIKIMDMEMAMEFTDAHRDRAIAIADEAFENIHGGVEMMTHVEQEEIFKRLESYYQTYMNISYPAIQNFIADYRKNFVQCRAYESMINFLRLEITQNFCCEDEKNTFIDHVKELDEADSEWRDRVSDDWRIKAAREETGDPE